MLSIIGLIGAGLTGCDRPMTESMMDTVTPPEMPTTDDPEAFTVAFVQAAVDLYKSEGRDAAIAHYNDPASVEGQWYVFITDENDTFVSHAPAPELIGGDLKATLAIDGADTGVEVAMATEVGRWTEYLWTNPATNKLGNKRTWSIRHDGYLFGAGYYAPWSPDPATLLAAATKDDPEDYTRAVVLAAIALYEKDGLEAVTTHYNDKASIDGQWYVFITDPDDIMIAHAPRPDFIGRDNKTILGLDGKRMLGAEIAQATSRGLWIEYVWVNPANDMEETKRTWAIRHNGYLFGSGYHQPVAAGSTPATEGPTEDSTPPAADSTPPAN